MLLLPAFEDKRRHNMLTGTLMKAESHLDEMSRHQKWRYGIFGLNQVEGFRGIRDRGTGWERKGVGGLGLA